MNYILAAIIIPFGLLGAFIGLNMYYDWKDHQKFINQNKQEKFSDEVNRLLEMDETEKFYHN